MFSIRSHSLARSIGLGLALGCTPTSRQPPSSEDERAPASEPAPSLDGRIFWSESVEGYSLVPDTRIRIEFREDGSFRASAGCNAFRSDVVGTSTGVLDVYDPVQTMVYCGEQRGAQDDWLGAFIHGKPAWSFVEPRLTLRSEDVTVVLIDEASAPAPADGLARPG